MTDFFLRDGDMQRAESAVYMDDIDMVPSEKEIGPWGPILVVVALRDGKHVCQQCGEPFSREKPHLRGKEVKTKGATVPIMLHEGCANRKKRSLPSVHDLTRGMQARRFFAKAVNGVEEATAEKKSSIIT
jgi:hypothetical protein